MHQNSDQFYCSKTVVQNILISHLKEEHLYLKGPKERKQFMNNIISKSCWEKVELALKRELIESDPNDARSIFFALNINQALSPGQYHEWMTRYFLQAPPVGELLNLSWNALKALSENYALREQVLKALESQELLPGKVFKSLNTSRSQALAFHLQESFPEYIKLYAMTCLTYLEGKASFPYGNPTPQCHRLFAITQRGSSKLKSLVTVPLRERYLKTVPKNMNSISLREN